jgi:hypothetical protein
VRLDADEGEHLDEPLVLAGQRPDLGPELRERIALSVAQGI